MRILVLGGTGAMGVHLCRLLANGGNAVSVTTRKQREDTENLQYIVGDAKENSFLEPILSQGWDVIVDFMVWSTTDFSLRVDNFLRNSNQYVFLSSYRVYADSPVISEDSPRLLDSVDDSTYLATDEYALAKARCEDLLANSGCGNWTVARPAITYDGSAGRLQLGVHEARDWLWRSLNGVSVPMPIPMLNKQTTMTWGGDVAKMLAGLVGNPVALGEAYTVATSDHMSWEDVADIYASSAPLEIVNCDLARFEHFRGGAYQVRYDRLFNRIIDNSKILSATGIRQDELVGMREGLARELLSCISGNHLPAPSVKANARLDKLVGGMPSLAPLLRSSGKKWVDGAKYFGHRFVNS